MTTRFVSTSEIQRLTEGSFETVIAHLCEALPVSLKGARVLATFPERAVVVTPGGEFFQVRYESKGGACRVLETAPCEVQVVSDESLGVFAQSEAKRAVEAFLSGDMKEALRMTRDLSKMPLRTEKFFTEERLIDALEEEIGRQTPWKTVLRDRNLSIRRMFGGQQVESKYVPKYVQLVGSAGAEMFRKTVKESLRQLSKSVSVLLKQTTEDLETQRGKLTDGDLNESSIRAFHSFAEDLLVDLRRLDRIVSEGSEQLTLVSCLGRLYDAVASEFRRYEVAGKFVHVLTERLSCS